jgi:thiamine biosynthesis lipoprotein
LGSSVEVVVSEMGELEAAAAAVAICLEQVDLAANRFRADSEIRLLNESNGQEREISLLLRDLLAEALAGAAATGGLVTPTVGGALVQGGYDVDFAAITDRAKGVGSGGQSPSYRQVELDVERNRVRLCPGVMLDLGATAKARASDLASLAAARVIRKGGVLVSLGGDIAVAGESPTEGWTIQVSEDSAMTVRAEEEKIAIWQGGVATSSIKARRWKWGGQEWQHIFDPRTGLPAQGRWRTASVVASRCVDANVAATAALIMDEAAIAWLNKQQLAARLVGRDGQVVRLGGWPIPPLEA